MQEDNKISYYDVFEEAGPVVDTGEGLSSTQNKNTLSPEWASQTAMLSALVSTEGNLYDVYTQVKSDLLANGQSDVLDSLERIITEEDNKEVRDYIKTLVTTSGTPTQAIINTIKAYEQESREEGPLTLDKLKAAALRRHSTLIPTASTESKTFGQLVRQQDNTLMAENVRMGHYEGIPEAQSAAQTKLLEFLDKSPKDRGIVQQAQVAVLNAVAKVFENPVVSGIAGFLAGPSLAPSISTAIEGIASAVSEPEAFFEAVATNAVPFVESDMINHVLTSLQDAGYEFKGLEAKRDVQGKLIRGVSPLVGGLLDIANEIVGGKGAEQWLLDRTHYGDIKHAIRDKFTHLPPEEKRAFALSILNSLASWKFVGGGTNEYGTVRLIEELLQFQDPNKTDWASVIDNIVGVLDATAIADVFGAATKSVTRVAPDSTLSILNAANPQETSILAAAAVKDKEFAEALGTTPEAIVKDFILPKQDKDLLTAAPDDIVEHMADLDRQAAELGQDTSTFGIFYDEPTRANAKIRELEHIQTVANGHLLKNMTKIMGEGEGIRVKAMYGQNEDYGFSTFEDALDFGKRIKAEDEQIPYIYFRDPESGRLRKVNYGKRGKRPAGFPEIGEYFVRSDWFRPFNSEDALTFGNDAASVPFALGRNLSDPDAIFGLVGMKGKHHALRASHSTISRLLGLVHKPLKRLRAKQRKELASVLQQGLSEGKNYTYEELISNFPQLTRNQIGAYFSVRKFWDTVWAIENRRLYRKTAGENYYTNSELDFHALGKGLDDISADRLAGQRSIEVLDPEQGSAITLTPEILAELRAEGKSIVRSDRLLTLSEGDSKIALTNYFIMGPKIAKRPRPKAMLQYNEGYYSTIYTDDYLVERVVKAARINGQPLKNGWPKAIRTARTLGSATKLAEQLNRSAPKGVFYRARPMQELRSQEEGFRDVADELVNHGRLFFSKRGERLLDQTGEASSAMDPIHSISKVVTAVGYQLNLGEFLDIQRNRFFTRYEELLGMPPEQARTLPDALITQRLREPFAITSDRLRVAKEEWGYIRTMSGMLNAPDAAWRAVATATAEWAEKYIGSKLSRAVLKAGEFRPASAVKQLAYTLLLVGAPIRNILLQGQQFMFLLGPTVLSSASFGLALRDSLALAGGLAIRTRPGLWEKAAPGLAKSMGLSTKEYKDFIDIYKKSGAIQSVDSHTFVSAHTFNERAAYATSPIESIFSAVKKGATAPISIARRVGIDVGEQTNRAVTYSIARRRWIKDNPGKAWNTKSNSAEILELAASYELAMQKSGQFKYQEGWFTLGTQFVSIQQKAYLAILPEVLGGSKVFTPRDKLGIFLGQLLYAGGAGWGLTSAINSTLEEFGLGDLPDKVVEFINGGAMDVFVNTTLEAITGEDQDIRLARELAPGGALTRTIYKTIFEEIGNSNTTYLEAIATAFGGAGAHSIGRLGESLARLSKIYSKKELPPLETLMEYADAIGRMFSGYRSWVSYKVHDNVLKKVAGSKLLPLELTQAEAWADRLLGISAAPVEEYYEAREKFFERKEDIEEFVREYYNNMNKYYIEDAASASNKEDFMARLETKRLVLNALDDRDDFLYAMEYFNSLVEKDIRHGVPTIFDYEASLLERAMIKDLDEYRVYLSNLQGITPEQKEKLMAWVDYLEGHTSKEDVELHKKLLEDRIDGSE